MLCWKSTRSTLLRAIHALKGLSVHVEQGEIVTLIGPMAGQEHDT